MTNKTTPPTSEDAAAALTALKMDVGDADAEVRTLERYIASLHAHIVLLNQGPRFHVTLTDVGLLRLLKEKIVEEQLSGDRLLAEIDGIMEEARRQKEGA